MNSINFPALGPDDEVHELVVAIISTEEVVEFREGEKEEAEAVQQARQHGVVESQSGGACAAVQPSSRAAVPARQQYSKAAVPAGQ